MKHVNIVTEPPERAWILRRMASELTPIPGVRIHEPVPGEATYYINYALMPEKPGPLDLAYFTHVEGGPLEGAFHRNLGRCFPVLMNRGLTKHLHPNRSIYKVIHPGSALGKREPVFGIAGRTYPSGRKGEKMVLQMVEAGYKVVFCEEVWDLVKEHPNVLQPPRSGSPWFWEIIDSLVVPSLNEGGPVPVLDALAARVPVIAPNVGFCWDYPVIHYERGDWNSLNDVLSKLAKPRTWDDWRADHERLFRDLELL